MRFGITDITSAVAFELPSAYPIPDPNLSRERQFRAYIGLSKWNRADVKNFYPPGTKSEQLYYATQFNSIEMNATFYKRFPDATFKEWKDRVPEGFKFFPRLGQDISHFRRLRDFEELVEQDVQKFRLFEQHLGTIFIQPHNNFGPKDFKDVRKFVENWKYDEKLAVEFRAPEWYSDPGVRGELTSLLEENKIGHVIIDTLGRRDLVHMRLTTPWAYIRFVGCGVEEIDHRRLDGWVEQLGSWISEGITEIDFFVHSNDQRNMPQLAAYFIDRLNNKAGIHLHVPKIMKTSHNS